MLNTLLESEAKREKSAAATFLSATAHTALLAAALYATAQARTEPARSPEMVRPVYFPTPRQAASTLPRVEPRQRSLPVRPLTLVAPRIDVHVPAVDITGFVTKPGDFSPTRFLSRALTASMDRRAGARMRRSLRIKWRGRSRSRLATRRPDIRSC